jgi:hypothetical protein
LEDSLLKNKKIKINLSFCSSVSFKKTLNIIELLSTFGKEFPLIETTKEIYKIIEERNRIKQTPVRNYILQQKYF